MSVGTIWDGYYYARQLRDVLEANEYSLLYVEVADEHAWGNWRALLDDLLIYFFAPGIE
jgi:enterochelin esterase family protein